MKPTNLSQRLLLFILLCCLSFLFSCSQRGVKGTWQKLRGFYHQTQKEGNVGLIHIDGTLQGLYSYYNQTLEEGKVHLIHVDAAGYEQAAEKDSSVVYVMHGQALREVVAKQGRTLVYIWVPRCSGDRCYSLDRLQEYCTQNGMALFIVAFYYDTTLMAQSYQLENPIIGIDVKHYGTNLTGRYFAKFLSDLVDTPTSPDQAEQWESEGIVYFEQGQFVKFCRDIGELGPAWSEWGMR